MATHPVIAGCLAAIQRGDVTAVGVLADLMEENGVPKAKAVRKLWATYTRRAAYFAAHDFSRDRRWTYWESVAYDRRSLRRKVRDLFGRKWKPLPLARFAPSGGR